MFTLYRNLKVKVYTVLIIKSNANAYITRKGMFPKVTLTHELSIIQH
jgi:hypothetical protein